MIAKKSLGQNFLKDEKVLNFIANSFEVTSKDLLIEIGPGMGALTKYLVKKPAFLLCYEIDKRMEKFLNVYKSPRTFLIYDDFLKRNFKKDFPYHYQNVYVIANIPYYITTPIVEHILNQEVVDGMTLLVQKEVALRFCASSKTKDYGYFTVFLQHFFQIEYLFDVPSTSFEPSPKVTSAVVRFTKKENIYPLDFLKFQTFLKQAFHMKRKTLKNNLKGYDLQILSDFYRENGFSDSLRAEELCYDDFVKLFLKF